MNITQIFQDFSIPHSTHGKNISEGWIGLSCPYCGDDSTHLGFNPDGNYFSCWRCGKHPLVLTFSKLMNLPEPEVRQILKNYEVYTKSPIVKVDIEKRQFKIPTDIHKLSEQHRQYLLKRNFDPDRLARIFGLQGTGPMSRLDGSDYRHRIFIPFYWDGKLVSFDTRDITGKAVRYKACPKKYELIGHKDILYGKQENWTDTGICVEGPSDVWRLGVRAFATSGIQFTQAQVRAMSKLFKRVFVVYDKDTQAQRQASKLVSELMLRKVDAIGITIDQKDPGSMSEKESEYFVKQLIG